MNNFIYAKTIDGKDISLDGLKVEFFSFHYIQPHTDCLEIFFKSGQTVQVINEDEGHGEPQERLVSVMQTDRTAVPAPKPDCLVQYMSHDGREGLLDSYAVEFIISYKCDEKEYADLHLDSGKTLTVDANYLDNDDAPLRRNILEDYIYRYNKDHSK